MSRVRRTRPEGERGLDHAQGVPDAQGGAERAGQQRAERDRAVARKCMLTVTRPSIGGGQ
jgi:hypothetical protein